MQISLAGQVLVGPVEQLLAGTDFSVQVWQRAAVTNLRFLELMCLLVWQGLGGQVEELLEAWTSQGRCAKHRAP